MISLTYFVYHFKSVAFSERPIREKALSADTDNRPILPILSADISAENKAKKWDFEPQKLYQLFLT